MLNNELLFNNIKKLCDNKDIKITNLEKELGFGGGIISRWGNGADPSLSKVVDIADYFHVTLDEVVGRNQNTDENYDFINLIIEQTKSKELQWKNYFSQTFFGERCNIPEEICFIISDFNKYPDYQRRTESFYTKCNYGYFMLSCYFIMQNDIIDKYELFFYIQPNDKKEGIIQKCNQEQLLNLFKAIDYSINGDSSEIIANNFKKMYMRKYFINSYQSNSNKIKVQADTAESTIQILDYVEQLDQAELQKMINIFTDPKMSQALEFVQKITTHFTDSQSTKQNQKFIFKKIQELSKIHGDVLYDIKTNKIIKQDTDNTGVTKKSKEFYRNNKLLLGKVVSAQGKNCSRIFLISDSAIMQLTGFSFGKHYGMTGYNGMIDILKEAGFDVSDQSIFEQKEFVICK